MRRIRQRGLVWTVRAAAHYPVHAGEWVQLAAVGVPDTMQQVQQVTHSVTGEMTLRLSVPETDD